MHSAEEKREIGKAWFLHHNGDMDRRRAGLKLILEAYQQQDPEAMYLVSRLILDGALRVSVPDQREYALRLLCRSANEGCIQARGYLNRFCEDRYRAQFQKGSDERVRHEGLVDWEGKPIKINRQGIFTPIDGVLEHRDGRNILNLSTNVQFLYLDEMAHPDQFRQAVLRGIRAWQGEYEVFGGQKVSVQVNLTEEDRLFDNLFIVPITDEVGDVVQSVSNAIGSKKRKMQLTDVMENKRSFATSGIKWTVNSRKFIFLQSEDGRFEDYEELFHVTKHEFGHALGLGDLYTSATDGLPGVPKGTYEELDCYSICDRFYHLVMCDHHGPISNNDIEMVILAFRENRMQLYQPSRLKGTISSALGKGN